MGRKKRIQQWAAKWYPEAKDSAKNAIQFDWRRLWTQKVKPYLQEELVQASLDYGMRFLDPSWKRGDAPCDLGSIGWEDDVEGELSWYQPRNRCHAIAFFSMAIGVLNYPDLDWRFASGDLHTVPVGYDASGEPRVVMDILCFEYFTAAQSLAHTQAQEVSTSSDARSQWDAAFQEYITNVLPALKERAQELGRPVLTDSSELTDDRVAGDHTMEVMIAYLTSSTAKVIDRATVEAIISQYRMFGDCEHYFVEDEDEPGAVRLGFDGRDWPIALRHEKYGRSLDILEDFDKAYDLAVELSGREDSNNFVGMLAALGPYLKTPLTVQMVQYEDDGFPIWACEWHVRPGTGHVEINQFKHSDDEEGAPDREAHV
jgi:hypothetical protein